MSASVIPLRIHSLAPLPEGYVNGRQLMARAGLTARRMNYWTDAGYLRLAGRFGTGFQRAYPAAEVAVARLIGALVDDGLLPHVAAVRARDLLDTGVTHVAGMPLHLPQEL